MISYRPVRKTLVITSITFWILLILLESAVFAEHPLNRISRLIYEEDCRNMPEIESIMRYSGNAEARAKAVYGLAFHCSRYRDVDQLVSVAGSDTSPKVRNVALRGIRHILIKKGGSLKPVDVNFLQDQFLNDLSRKNRDLIKSLLNYHANTPEPVFRAVLTSEMNLRDRGSLNARITGTVAKGTQVMIVDETAGYDACHSWIKVLQGNSVSGWVCGNVQGRTKYKLLK